MARPASPRAPRRRFASEAEYLRHHRKCFELALELGCTPREAEDWLEAVRKREELRAWCSERGLAWNPEPLPAPRGEKTDFGSFEAPWMMRD